MRCFRELSTIFTPEAPEIFECGKMVMNVMPIRLSVERSLLSIGGFHMSRDVDKSALLEDKRMWKSRSLIYCTKTW